MAKRRALGFGHRLAHDLAQGVAEGRAHGEGDDENRQHDERRLPEAPRSEAQSGADRSHRLRCVGLTPCGGSAHRRSTRRPRPARARRGGPSRSSGRLDRGAAQTAHPLRRSGLQAPARLIACAAMPVPKAVRPAPIAPPTRPASTHPTTSRFALAPSAVPNTSEPTIADITSFAVLTATSQPTIVSAMASRHLPRSRLTQSHSMAARPGAKGDAGVERDAVGVDEDLGIFEADIRQAATAGSRSGR